MQRVLWFGSTLINIDENIVVQSNRPRYNVTIPPSEIHPHPLGPPSVVGRNGCFLCLFLITTMWVSSFCRTHGWAKMTHSLLKPEQQTCVCGGCPQTPNSRTPQTWFRIWSTILKSFFAFLCRQLTNFCELLGPIWMLGYLEKIEL